MIPVELRLCGFLSYRDAVTVDFRKFDLACISGQNGAGKSSLLDAITWVLFGQARRRDDAVINSGTKTAEVCFLFDYEGNRFRVVRSKQKDKSVILEFNSLDADGNWKVLTEHTVRETEERIKRTLRMDYDTFTNASFFLQGKADQFSQQPPGNRKQILSNILGLDVWDTYRKGAAARRRSKEHTLAEIEGQLKEIEAELAEEDSRRERLKELESRLKELSELRTAKEKYLESQSKLAADLEHQKQRVEDLTAQLQTAIQRRDQHDFQLAQRRREQAGIQEQIAHAAEIEKDYASLQTARKELASWEQVGAKFFALQQERSPFLAEIQSEKARLETERINIEKRKTETQLTLRELPEIERNLTAERDRATQLQNSIQARETMKEELVVWKEEQAALEQENKTTRIEMEELNERIQRLRDAQEETCPLCGSDLNAEDRESLIDKLENQGKTLADRFRSNEARLKEIKASLAQTSAEINRHSDLDQQLRQTQKRTADLEAREETIKNMNKDWELNYASRLLEVEKSIANEDYAAAARAHSSELDSRLQALNYDPIAHEMVRQQVENLGASEDRKRELDMARSALKPLSDQINDLQVELVNDNKDCASRQAALSEAEQQYQERSADLPDLQALETELKQNKLEENQKRFEVGSARQKVEVLTSLKERREGFISERSDIKLEISRLRTLESAFGKDGVPALLIEQALPEIRDQANSILEGLSNGTMSIRFDTLREYKDRNREDKKETLDIVISDPAGEREYEMFSGGEAFRINFAIRLALSRVLARRAGARLQTLVIDEGFGSQDADGRQRLIEAIIHVRPDFSKILVITHLEELKDAFSARVEVEKIAGGSTVQVVLA